MNDKKFSRGGRNPHVKTTEKKPCEVCKQSVDHYSDGTISRHKVYIFKVVNGINTRTSKWSYCNNVKWD